MSRVRSCCWYLVMVAAGLVLTIARPLDAASFALAPGERDAAVRMGKRSIVTADFGGEWTVRGDAPDQTLVVMTPFHRLALAARNSAFKGEDLNAKDIDSLLKDHEGKLVVWATLRGPRSDFARFYAPKLVRGQQEIKPSFVQNERTAWREEDGRFTARCFYVFPVEGVAPNAKVEVVVRDAEDKPAARFNVDLAAMR